MTAVGLLLLCILVTLPSVLPGCIDQNERLSDFNKSLNLLDSVGERLPKDCQEEAMRINIDRQDLLNLKKEDTIPTLKQVFKLTRKLYNEIQILAIWDSSKMNDFINLLERQYGSYSNCVKDMTLFHKTKKDQMRRMRKYYKKLTQFLSTEKHSRCAWEIVRGEILTLFRKLKKIILELGD